MSISRTLFITISYQFQKGEEREHNPNFEQEIDNLNLDKGKNIFFICRSGARSQNAAEIFEKKGSKEGSTQIQGGFVIEKAFAEK